MAENVQEAKVVPDDLVFEGTVVDVCCHPSEPVLATAHIEGDVKLHRYSLKKNTLVSSLTHHKQSCRCARFTPSGDKLITTARDRSIQVVNVKKEQVITKLKHAHECAVYSLLPVDEHMLVSGDDDGTLKVWDLRTKGEVMNVKENDEYISDMLIKSNHRLLLATSGDGTLTCFDIRKHKMKLQSETFDSELLSLSAAKEGKNVVVGTGEGVLNIFNWGEWGNISDRFPGHPMSVDCIVPISDDVVCTGSSDGNIRAVHILPNRFLGVVGEHEDFPVEALSKSHCGKYLVSCSHDHKAKFWDIGSLEFGEIDSQEKPKLKEKVRKLWKTETQQNFFSDLSEGASGSQDKDDEDDKDDKDDDADSDDSLDSEADSDSDSD